MNCSSHIEREGIFFQVIWFVDTNWYKMAKWGEGDPRWIVEERPDATNVNNWHW